MQFESLSQICIFYKMLTHNAWKWTTLESGSMPINHTNLILSAYYSIWIETLEAYNM